MERRQHLPNCQLVCHQTKACAPSSRYYYYYPVTFRCRGKQIAISIFQVLFRWQVYYETISCPDYSKQAAYLAGLLTIAMDWSVLWGENAVFSAGREREGESNNLTCIAGAEILRTMDAQSKQLRRKRLQLTVSQSRLKARHSPASQVHSFSDTHECRP